MEYACLPNVVYDLYKYFHFYMSPLLLRSFVCHLKYSFFVHFVCLFVCLFNSLFICIVFFCFFWVTVSNATSGEAFSENKSDDSTKKKKKMNFSRNWVLNHSNSLLCFRFVFCFKQFAMCLHFNS